MDSGMQMIKAIGLQRDYILFFMACAKTDQAHFIQMLSTTFGEDPLTGTPSKSLQMAIEAIEKNTSTLRMMKEQVAVVMRACSAQMSAINQEITTWRKEWRKDEVKRAPNTVATIIPFLIDITRSDSFKDDKRARAAAKLVERIMPFYAQLDAPLNPIDSWKLIVRLKAWVATSRILGLNPDKTMVVSAYYPNPIEDHLDASANLLLEEGLRAARDALPLLE